MNGSTWDDYRFSLNNEHPNFFLEPWHHIYYNEQFKEAGFAEISRYISLLDEEMNFEDKLAEKREKEMQAEGIIFRPADMNNFEGELVAIHDFCLEAFKDNFLFTPITQESFLSKYLKIEKIINPEYFIIAEDKNKNILGFIFAIDDLFNTDKKTLIIKTVARHPSRKYYGMGNILGKKIYDIAKKNKYDSVLHAFMIDDGLSKNISRKFSGKAYKQYALYGMAI